MFCVFFYFTIVKSLGIFNKNWVLYKIRIYDNQIVSIYPFFRCSVLLFPFPVLVGEVQDDWFSL
jgi:hypothetical protein